VFFPGGLTRPAGQKVFRDAKRFLAPDSFPGKDRRGILKGVIEIMP
jgi:hypothetical protein